MSEDFEPIRCSALTKRYGDVIGVEQVDLAVPAGTITGFLGANGAGKTTLIRVLVGLLRPTSGDALLWGQPSSEPASRRRLGFMPADPAFYGDLTGLENLDLLAAVRGGGSEDREWATGLLELDPADLRRPVGGYSSGMVQKLALVQTVQHRPDLVILDEPANRLDPLAHRRFEELVRTIAADGRTVFLSSHTLSEVQDVCDRVAMIRAGRLLAVQAVADLQRLAARRVHAVYRHPPARIPDGLSGVELDGNELTARLTGGHVAVLRAVVADPDLVDLTVEPPTLEDAFVELYASQEA